jgi:antitoxin component of RelBE/YafQ-DinJ toxin-antitoxin module
MSNRIAIINIKVTPSVKEELIKKAGGMGLSLSSFCRMVLFEFLKKEG